MRLESVFYVFLFPRSWAKLFAFDHACRAGDYKLRPEDAISPDATIWWGAVTAPMGYRSAMGLVQYFLRRVHAAGAQSPEKSLPLCREIRKDREFPPALPADGYLSEL